MTDPLTTLLVNAEWLAIELKHDRGGDYLQEAETGNGITLAELVKRYNALLRSPAATVTGWRLLEVGEIMQEGDEMFLDDWYPCLLVGEKLDGAVVRRRLTPPAQGDEMRVLADMADRWEREYLSTGMKNVYRNAVDCANELRSAVAAVREGSEK